MNERKNMPQWMKNIYVLWREAQKSKFTGKNNNDDKVMRWRKLFEWNQNVGRIQRMIRKIAKKWEIG